MKRAAFVRVFDTLHGCLQAFAFVKLLSNICLVKIYIRDKEMQCLEESNELTLEELEVSGTSCIQELLNFLPR